MNLDRDASSYIKTHSSVSAAKKTKKDVPHTSVLFTGTAKLPNLAFCISKISKPISTKFIHFLPYIYTTSHTVLKLKEIASAVLETLVPKNCQFSSHFSSSTKLQIHLSCIKITFPCFKFRTLTYNAHWGLHFPKILRNSNKDWGSYVL